ncbi:hypothetical protein HWV62_21910 [Athelia sp. TMB]|nr:hypothetical protein HWV62_21910 [Athelia sp. TMB]
MASCGPYMQILLSTAIATIGAFFPLAQHVSHSGFPHFPPAAGGAAGFTYILSMLSGNLPSSINNRPHCSQRRATILSSDQRHYSPTSTPTATFDQSITLLDTTTSTVTTATMADRRKSIAVTSAAASDVSAKRKRRAHSIAPGEYISPLKARRPIALRKSILKPANQPLEFDQWIVVPGPGRSRENGSARYNLSGSIPFHSTAA